MKPTSERLRGFLHGDFSHYMTFLLGSSATSIAVRLQGSVSASDIGFPLALACIATVGLIFPSIVNETPPDV